MRKVLLLALILALSTSYASLSGCKSEADLARDRQEAEVQEQLRLKAEQLAQNQKAIIRVMHDASLTGDQDVQSHVDALRSINISDCPPEFQLAFNKYVRGWDEAVQVREAKEKVDADEGNAALGGTLATWFGSSATPWSDHIAAEKKLDEYKAIANSDIHSSYEDMRDAASRYGVQLS